MCCSGSSGGGSQSSASQLDPQIKQDMLDWYANQQKIQGASQNVGLTQSGTDANGNPTYGLSAYTPYTGQRVAGVDPQQQRAMDLYGSGVGAYQPGLDAASGAALNAASYRPSDAGAQAYSAKGYTASGVAPGSLASTNLAPYLNPFTQDVTNTTINDFKRASDLNALGSQQAATQAGAFGGSGQGVFQANNQDNLNRALASTLAGLNQSNFTNAQTQATNDLNRDFSGQAFNADAANTANQFGANAINAANQFNANAANTASMFNSNLGLQGAQLRAAQAPVLANIGMANQQGLTNDTNNLMALGGANRDITQQGLDWNYQNNYYNPNYMQPQWDVSLLNAGQGNAPQGAYTSASSGNQSSANGSCGCG